VAKAWKAGVIGCGAIAQALHLPGYRNCRGAELVAACDTNPKRFPEVRKIHKGVRTYTNYRRMLAENGLDIVSVATPNARHAEHACAALEAGAHVFLEKPAATTMKEIARIKQTLKKTKRQLIVGYSHRFHRGNRKLKQLLAKGTIGEPFMIRLRLAHTGPLPGWAKDGWFHDPKQAAGGAMLDMGIHAIDQCNWLIGPVKHVQAMSRTLRKKIKLDDCAVLLLEFDGGRTLGYIEVGWSSPAGFNGIEVMGDSGCIICDYTHGMTVTTGKVTPNMKSRPRLKTRLVDKAPSTGGWPVEIDEVVKAMRTGDNLGAGIDAGGAALAVALAAYESSKTGKRVAVNSIR
jgi:UDP-N-acetylglucosamine 3-dehydrogenase